MDSPRDAGNTGFAALRSSNDFRTSDRLEAIGRARAGAGSCLARRRLPRGRFATCPARAQSRPSQQPPSWASWRGRIGEGAGGLRREVSPRGEVLARPPPLPDPLDGLVFAAWVEQSCPYRATGRAVTPNRGGGGVAHRPLASSGASCLRGGHTGDTRPAAPCRPCRLVEVEIAPDQAFPFPRVGGMPDFR